VKQRFADTPLRARSAWHIALAVILGTFTLTWILFVALNSSSWSTLLGPAGILGAGTGFLIAGQAMCRIEVYSDRVVIVNPLRILHFDRQAIERLESDSGLSVVARNGSVYQVSVFSQALGKRLLGNKAARDFAGKMVMELGLDPAKPNALSEESPPSTVKSSIRVSTPLMVLVVATGAIGMAALIRAA